MTAPDPLLVVVLGPTASGKTALSLALAEHLARPLRPGAEIVNCDSVALYRDFEIGTAKPSAAEHARVPHHLLDVAAPTEPMTAGEYARRARTVLAEIKARGFLPIIVGGTGLYLRALLEGLSPGPQRSEELRQRLRTIARNREDRLHSSVIPSDRSEAEGVEGPTFAGSEYLHRILRRLDPAAASRIHGHDQPKIIRAIEVCLKARQPLTKIWQSGREPLRGFRILRLGLDPDRAALYARINHRAAGMFASGLVEETAALIYKYLGGAPSREGERPEEIIVPLNSMGYKQAVQLLRNEIDIPSAIAAAQQAHRNYAKRQMTWFRREPDVHWLHGFGDEPAVQQQAVQLIESCRPWSN